MPSSKMVLLHAFRAVGSSSGDPFARLMVARRSVVVPGAVIEESLVKPHIQDLLEEEPDFIETLVLGVDGRVLHEEYTDTRKLVARMRERRAREARVGDVRPAGAFDASRGAARVKAPVAPAAEPVVEVARFVHLRCGACGASRVVDRQSGVAERVLASGHQRVEWFGAEPVVKDCGVWVEVSADD